MATVAADSSAATDPDPIIASYTIFTNRPPASNRRLVVLQHPNKAATSDPEAGSQVPPINEVRIKPNTGMVEVDVPLNFDNQYDRDRGMRWGAALQKSTAAKNGGSHGLAGGFGVGVPATRGGRRKADDDKDIDLIEWSEAMRQDKVLRMQTLGGQLGQEGECSYMVGVFKDDQLHLTPVSSLIQLRPQLHHLDAIGDQERRATGAAGTALPGGGGGGGANAAGKDGAAQAGGGQGTARAIHMTIKSASSEGVSTETMTDRLRAVQMEGWQRLKYVDEDNDQAWKMYQECLVFNGAGEAAMAQDDKGKGPEGQTPSTAQLETQAARLRAGWGEDELLNAISGTREASKEGEHETSEKTKKGKGRDKQKAGGEDGVAQSGAKSGVAAKTKPRAAAASKRGGKAKAGASRGTAMELD